MALVAQRGGLLLFCFLELEITGLDCPGAGKNGLGGTWGGVRNDGACALVGPLLGSYAGIQFPALHNQHILAGIQHGWDMDRGDTYVFVNRPKHRKD